MKVLLVVDLQRDFTNPTGSLYVFGTEHIVGQVEWLMTDYDQVVLTQDWHPEETTHWGKWPKHCIAGTTGARFDVDIEDGIEHLLNNGDFADPEIIQKGTLPNEDGYSAFFSVSDDGDLRSTGLGDKLVSWGATEVHICGTAGDICVDATVVDSVKAGADTWSTKVILPLVTFLSVPTMVTCLNKWRNLGVEIIGANTVKN